MASRFILLGDDFSIDNKKAQMRSELLEKLAGEMARRLKMELKVLYALDVPQDIIQKDEVLPLIAEYDARKYPVKASLDFQEGSPVEIILQEDAKKNGPALLVLGSRGHKGIKKMLLGSVSEEVLRRATKPVLVLGAEAQERRYKLSTNKKMKIMVLTDLKPASGPAERYALNLAKTLDADVVLMHSVGEQIRRLKDMLYSRRVVSSGVDEMFKQMRDDANFLLNKKVKSFQQKGIGVEGHLLLDEKDISPVVCRQVEERKCDIVIMGTHSRNKFLTAFLGSTARNMILRSPVPVLIVRSKS